MLKDEPNVQQRQFYEILLLDFGFSNSLDLF
jgi:hypothetical protein